MAINGIKGLDAITPLFTDNKLKVDNTENIDFGKFLSEALNKVNDAEAYSKQVTEDFIVGKTDNIHEVMIAGEKASIALQFTMEIRNKLLEAYNEIMRMQI